MALKSSGPSMATVYRQVTVPLVLLLLTAVVLRYAGFGGRFGPAIQHYWSRLVHAQAVKTPSPIFGEWEEWHPKDRFAYSDNMPTAWCTVIGAIVVASVMFEFA